MYTCDPLKLTKATSGQEIGMIRSVFCKVENEVQ